ncbi:hypothetical protein AB0J80_02965 [Actinoplanes sp. NPDC049548]|uniref:hypothetical protein n=1 Tax=Actinoplanes sp. NPDC049548 TaxID=3155152 RepID=UPI0034173155
MVEEHMTAALSQARRAVAPAPPVGHRPSHRRLLIHPSPVEPDDVAAVVVPTVRHPAAMRDSLILGRELGRPVVALCSGKWSSAREVCERAEALGAELIAVDLADVRLPAFESDRLLSAHRHLSRTNDVSVKRNVGLAVARMLRWRSVAFVDDDITDLGPEAIRTAGGLLRDHNVAALENVGYPDNSVVCHARRAVGMRQDTFVGGGAMAVRVNPRTPFFPTIYNEDWFFLVGRRSVERVALCGKVSQREYDPYLSPDRARSQEFGDCLAEGLLALSDRERPALAADADYWKAFLADRIAMIDEILAQLGNRRQDDRHRRMVRALKVARGRCQIIDPAFCVRYLAAWQDDLDLWRRFLSGLPALDDPVDAFAHLGVSAVWHTAM